MFEVPGAKRVKRSELFGLNSSSDDEADNVASRKDQSGQSPSKTKSRSNQNHPSSKGPGVTRTRNEDEVDTEVEQPTINYGFEYDFVDKVPQTQAALTPNPQISQDAHATKNTPQSTTDTADQSQSFEFNLFAPKVKAKASLKPTLSVDPDSTSSPSSTKPKPTSTSVSTAPPPNPEPGKRIIVIRNNSPTPDPTGSASPASKKYNILQPRPQSHYFTASQPESTRTQRQQQYSIAAIPPTRLTELSTSPWPGTHLPWRVLHIHTLDNKARAPRAAKAETKRGRPSKKRRVQMRTRVEARRAVVEQGVVAAEAEREKRTRRNREKKVKKKLREKAKKAEARLEGGADHAGEEGR